MLRRGLTIPPRALKSDLVRALEFPAQPPCDAAAQTAESSSANPVAASSSVACSTALQAQSPDLVVGVLEVRAVCTTVLEALSAISSLRSEMSNEKNMSRVMATVCAGDSFCTLSGRESDNIVWKHLVSSRTACTFFDYLSAPSVFHTSVAGIHQSCNRRLVSPVALRPVLLARLSIHFCAPFWFRILS